MSEAKHTPGPWRAIEDPCDDQDYKVLIVCGDGMTETWVARTEHNWQEASARERRISWAEAEANARLIAAAPELLEALEWIAANYENGHINHVDFRVEAKHRADAAIAKATGQ